MPEGIKHFRDIDVLRGYIDGRIGELPGNEDIRHIVVAWIARDIRGDAEDACRTWGDDWSTEVDLWFQNDMANRIPSFIASARQMAITS